MRCRAAWLGVVLRVLRVILRTPPPSSAFPLSRAYMVNALKWFPWETLRMPDILESHYNITKGPVWRNKPEGAENRPVWYTERAVCRNLSPQSARAPALNKTLDRSMLCVGVIGRYWAAVKVSSMRPLLVIAISMNIVATMRLGSTIVTAPVLALEKTPIDGAGRALGTAKLPTFSQATFCFPCQFRNCFVFLFLFMNRPKLNLQTASKHPLPLRTRTC